MIFKWRSLESNKTDVSNVKVETLEMKTKSMNERSIKIIKNINETLYVK